MLAGVASLSLARTAQPPFCFDWSNQMEVGDKNKGMDGVDLHFRCFAYVGDESDTSTWHCCIHVLGDPAKTVNAIKNSLARFDETKGIPDSERGAVWHTVRGAALAHNVRVDRSILTKKTEAPAQVAEPKPLKVKAHKPLGDKKLNELDGAANAHVVRQRCAAHGVPHGSTFA